MHERFRRARTVALRWPGRELEVVLAEGFRLRLMGLARLEADEIEPLLFECCRSIHTHGMRTAIDVVWLEADGGGVKVFDVAKALEPGRRAKAPTGDGPRRGVAALELAAGDAERLNLVEGSIVSVLRR